MLHYAYMHANTIVFFVLSHMQAYQCLMATGLIYERHKTIKT